MKTKYLLLITFLFAALEIMAQAPQAFKYQSVVRDGSGNILTGRAISVRATIRRSTSGGTIVYRETFAVTTNAYGIANLEIGTGTVVSGIFADIAWGAYSHYLQIEVDVNGGTSYSDLGAAQLLSVPYALYAKESANSQIADADKNTRVTTENAANENYIRFYTNGTERLRITPTGKFEPTASSIYFGNGAGKNNSSSYNVIIGDSAAAEATSMASSVAIGYRALFANTTGDYNTAVGALALPTNTTGSRNLAIGRGSLRYNTTGSYNAALGYYALGNNTTGNNNTALGYYAMYNNQTSSNSIAIGSSALYYQVGYTLSDTLNNIAIGNYALYHTDASTDLNGRNNLAIGQQAMEMNTTGDANIAIGTMAMRYNISGYYNTAVGIYSLYKNTGRGNTAIGRRAGEGNTTGYNNTFLGYGADASLGTITNAMALGYDAHVSASNSVQIGNASVTSIGGAVAWSITSDIRAKENLKYNNDLGLNFIMKLKPASYNYISDPRKTRHDGLVAQDVDKALKELGLKFDGLVVEENAEGTYKLAYSQFVVPLINAVQELNKQNQELLQRIEKLEKKSNKRNK
jgi:hypothetical protein